MQIVRSATWPQEPACGRRRPGRRPGNPRPRGNEQEGRTRRSHRWCRHRGRRTATPPRRVPACRPAGRRERPSTPPTSSTRARVVRESQPRLRTLERLVPALRTGRRLRPAAPSALPASWQIRAAASGRSLRRARLAVSQNNSGSRTLHRHQTRLVGVRRARGSIVQSAGLRRRPAGRSPTTARHRTTRPGPWVPGDARFEPVSSRTRTSRSRFATADPPGRVRESHPGAVRAANGTRGGRRSHPRIR